MKIFTGIQPSGDLHIGNYFGAIKPMLEQKNNLIMFIADYHAMTSVLKKNNLLKENIKKAAAAFVSLGLDYKNNIFYLQSDVKEVLELYWILSNFTPMGLLERAHSYKDKIAKGISPNHSLFSYPVLMAADILLFDANKVPVGKDQIQHIEIARDIAIKINNEFGQIFSLPEALIDENMQTIVGTDGAKMSKSYSNTIDIFTDYKSLKKQVNKIASDSTPLEEPKDWQNCNIFKIASLFLNEDEQNSLKQRYASGKEGYGHFKLYLCDVIWEYFSKARAEYERLLSTNEIYDILNIGKDKAKVLAKQNLDKIKQAMNI
ncbi:tryptophan--tRNA ligase [Campylobacter canadensis]|uniref:Tryptophan--tRNA ligase n=1 Tax=Campylobacter canadensis TaxID=449520 RepID=A0ABS7WS29_9BACT|nr:tryptophan--tRNA ligase [Campylobacter canadensis]MBZ7986884.1 tryptophan--tRNA ligase [Campylobacter canadensis]MBZ7994205.1 tryptophan--tRNA ligase [Campylobacter canadensis]MBZ7995802.1 tryptophan--tRNA ligase [Campylobacter canadensis]MBZ7997921.1 tryptophan--tRNA ligase [Campylobacter canadensis]MBZ7999537.1 tryptophan--tRNA ligase [Campylobacter canadensis]